MSTTSREQAPPIVMFVNKDRPKGLEVPACDRSNHGSSQSDQVAAFLAHIGPVTVLCRSQCSFKPLFFRMRLGFSIPMLNVDGADCRIR